LSATISNTSIDVAHPLGWDPKPPVRVSPRRARTCHTDVQKVPDEPSLNCRKSAKIIRADTLLEAEKSLGTG